MKVRCQPQNIFLRASNGVRNTSAGVERFHKDSAGVVGFSKGALPSDEIKKIRRLGFLNQRFMTDIPSVKKGLNPSPKSTTFLNPNQYVWDGEKHYLSDKNARIKSCSPRLGDIIRITTTFVDTKTGNTIFAREGQPSTIHAAPKETKGLFLQATP